MLPFRLFFLSFCLILLLWACAPTDNLTNSGPLKTIDPIATLIESPRSASQESLAPMGYSIQVGAFSRQENAVRMEQTLKDHGLDAYYFLHESGLYKVRFGDHGDYRTARRQAEILQGQQVIGRYFIVAPTDYSVAKIAPQNRNDLRFELVKTAKRFLGVPYRWGGEDSINGFDCSGLTMVSYRLNGLNLPRNSRAQYRAGQAVEKGRLQPGDLVFFATQGGTRVTHVGMYVGDNRFIHAPRTGKTIRISSLASKYFRRTYVGGRTYL